MKKALAHAPAARPTRTPFALPLTLPARLGGGLALLALVAGVGLFASRPARTAGGPIPVTVANPSLAVTDADAARQAVTGHLLLFGPVFSSPSGTLYTVPADKRLVIETVSASSNRNDANSYTIEVDTTTGGMLDQTFLTLLPNSALYSTVAQPLRLYADPGSMVQVITQNNGHNAPLTGVAFAGHLVDL